jgi:uncharacterized protein YllA (UPF0747 family)
MIKSKKRRYIMNNDEKLDLILSEMKNMRDDITDIKLTLENVTNKNIQILAEGHQIINRRLDDAIKAESNIEMTRIKLNIIEEEIKKLKKAVGI